MDFQSLNKAMKDAAKQRNQPSGADGGATSDGPDGDDEMPAFGLPGERGRASAGGAPSGYPSKKELADIPTIPEFQMPPVPVFTYLAFSVLAFVPLVLVFKVYYDMYLRRTHFGGLSLTQLFLGYAKGDLQRRILGDDVHGEELLDESGKRVPVDNEGRPLTSRQLVVNAMRKAKFVAVALRARRHVNKGLTDDEYFRAAVTSATEDVVTRYGRPELPFVRKTLAKRQKQIKSGKREDASLGRGGRSGMLSIAESELHEFERRTRNQKDQSSSGWSGSQPPETPQVKTENLAIFIGVDTESTPFATGDSDHLARAIFTDNKFHSSTISPSGKYTTCLFGDTDEDGAALYEGKPSRSMRAAEEDASAEDSTTKKTASSASGGSSAAKGGSTTRRVFVKPTSRNLMALIVDLVCCRNRRWGNVTIYLAAPIRPAPVSWLDEGIIRNEGTNYLARKDYLRSDLLASVQLLKNALSGGADDDAVAATNDFFTKNCANNFTGIDSSATTNASPIAAFGSRSDSSPPPIPKFTVEFLADSSEPENELSWVDMNVFLSRLREAVMESAKLVELTDVLASGTSSLPVDLTSLKATLRSQDSNFLVLVDAVPSVPSSAAAKSITTEGDVLSFPMTSVYDSIGFIDAGKNEDFLCDPTVGMSDDEAKSYRERTAHAQASMGVKRDGEAAAGAGGGGKVKDPRVELYVEKREFDNFRPPQEYLQLLASMTMHQAIAYSTATSLGQFQNTSIIVCPRRNFYIEKTVRQSQLKKAMRVSAVAGLSAPKIKTPLSVLQAMLGVDEESLARGGASATGSASLAFNPKRVGYSDFTRTLLEGFFMSSIQASSVPTPDQLVAAAAAADGGGGAGSGGGGADSLGDNTAAMAAMSSGVRGTVESSPFHCGRITVSSLARYLQSCQQMCYMFTASDVLTFAANGAAMIGGAGSAASVTTSAAAGKLLPTPYPLVSVIHRSRTVDSPLFVQVSLAPRGADCCVVPPVTGAPSHATQQRTEQKLMPLLLRRRYVNRIEDADPLDETELQALIQSPAATTPVIHCVPEFSESDNLPAYDPTAAIQMLLWNSELLRCFTDGVHAFDLDQLIRPALSTEAADVKYAVEDALIRCVALIIDQGSLAHFGTIPHAQEAKKVLMHLATNSQMLLVFLSADEKKDNNTTASLVTPVKALFKSIIAQLIEEAEESLSILDKDACEEKNKTIRESGASLTFRVAFSYRNQSSSVSAQASSDSIVELPGISQFERQAQPRKEWLVPSCSSCSILPPTAYAVMSLTATQDALSLELPSPDTATTATLPSPSSVGLSVGSVLAVEELYNTMSKQTVASSSSTSFGSVIFTMLPESISGLLRSYCIAATSPWFQLRLKATSSSLLTPTTASPVDFINILRTDSQTLQALITRMCPGVATDAHAMQTLLTSIEEVSASNNSDAHLPISSVFASFERNIEKFLSASLQPDVQDPSAEQDSVVSSRMWYLFLDTCTAANQLGLLINGAISPGSHDCCLSSFRSSSAIYMSVSGGSRGAQEAAFALRAPMSSTASEGIAGGIAAFEDLQPFLTTSPFLQQSWAKVAATTSGSSVSLSTMFACVHFPKPTPLRTVVYRGKDSIRNRLSLQWLLVSILSDASLLPLSSATKIRVPRLSQITQRVEAIRAACTVITTSNANATTTNAVSAVESHTTPRAFLESVASLPGGGLSVAKELATRILCEEVLDSSMMIITLLGCIPTQLLLQLLGEMEQALVSVMDASINTLRPKTSADLTNLFNTQELATTSLMDAHKDTNTSNVELIEVSSVATSDIVSAVEGTFCVALETIKGALTRVRGFETVLRVHTADVASSGAVVAPTYTEWWPLLALHTSLIDGNIGKVMSEEQFETLSGRKLLATGQEAAASALKEYDFDLKADGEDAKKAPTAAVSSVEGEGAKADDIPKVAAVKSSKNSDDPRLVDPACPVALIRSERPADVTTDPTVYASLLKALNKDAPAKVQFSQVFYREELGDDEDVPSTVEELGSDADEDDLAELNYKQQMRDNKRGLVQEAKRQGVLLNTDLPIAQSGRTYFRAFNYDALVLAPVTRGGVRGTSSYWCETPTAVTALAILDNKLYVGHVDGSISIVLLVDDSLSADQSVIVGTVPAEKAHKGVPVSDIIPYKRTYTDMADCGHYLAFSSRICPHPEETISGDSGAHFREKRFSSLIKATSTTGFADGTETAEDGNAFSTGIVTASKATRHIRIWSHNNLLTSPSIETNRLEASSSVSLKDPMARCFFATIARRGVDMKSLRQNIGNPEDMKNKREEDYVSMLTEMIKAAAQEEKDNAEEGSTSDDKKKKVKSIEERRKLAQGILSQIRGPNDTVLLQYGSNLAATQHPADADFNGYSFVGSDGIIQCVAALSFPPGHSVQAASVGPVGESGEARLVVAVSRIGSSASSNNAAAAMEVSVGGGVTDTVQLPASLPTHYVVQYTILRSA